MRSRVQATGKKKHDATGNKDSLQQLDLSTVGRGVILIGDLGFEQYKSGAQYVKQKRKMGQQGMVESSVGFGNVSMLGGWVEQQHSSEADAKPDV